MKNCPFPRCNEIVYEKQFCCHKHWKAMDRELKDAVMVAREDYAADLIPATEYNEVVSMVIDCALAAAATPYRPDTMPKIVTCRCGMACFKCHGEDPLLNIHPSGFLAIVGGKTVKRNTLGEQFTRFVYHKCEGESSGCEAKLA